MDNKEETVMALLDHDNISKIQSIVPASTPVFQPTNEEDYLQFISRIKSYLHNRSTLNLLPVSGKCLFVFVPGEMIRRVEEHWSRINRLSTNLDFDLTSTIFLCLNSNISKVRYLKVSGDTDVEIWNNLTDRQEEIEDICESLLCHICVDFALKTAIIHPAGNLDDSLIFDFSKSRKQISIAEMEVFAEELHEKETKYPNGATKIWVNQTKLELLPQPEDRIVRRFKSDLEDLIGPENVIYEATKLHGRSDIVIHSAGMVKNDGPCVLEFKVLQPLDAHQKNRKWLWKGVLQARDYGKNYAANNKYLLAYDARQQQVVIELLDKLADKYKVKYKFFRIFNTTPQEREEEIDSINDQLK